MKRSEMVDTLADVLTRLTKLNRGNSKHRAKSILKALEELGMKPPALQGDHGQAVIAVYIYPDFNMWEEDFNKDPKLVEALRRYRT